MYCLRPIVSTPEWGQLVFRRNGTWYGGIELDADETLIGAGKYT